MTVELVHKCIQQLHLLALHFEILGYIPGLLNGLEYLRRTGDFSGDNITRRLSKVIMESLEHNVLISWWKNELEELLSTESGLAMEDTVGEIKLHPFFEISDKGRP